MRYERALGLGFLERLIQFRVALVVVSALLACHPSNPNLSPAGQRAQTADDAVNRLGEFQGVVISLAQKNRIRLADARAIVTWISGDATACGQAQRTDPQALSKAPCMGIVDVLQTAPQGWQLTLRNSWYQVARPHVAASPDLSDWLTTIDQLVDSFGLGTSPGVQQPQPILGPRPWALRPQLT